jgi:hypothetical protein
METEVATQAAPPPSYWRETQQPIYSALLVLPFLVVYEAGLLLLKSDVINGGDAILWTLGRPMLSWVGIEAASASVIALIAFFVVAQIRRKGSWTVRSEMLLMSFLESLFFAAILFMMLRYFIPYLPGAQIERQRPQAALQVSLDSTEKSAPLEMSGKSSKQQATSGPRLRDFILYCGAGVYEELVFRVLLLGLLMLVFTKLFHLEHAYAAVWSVMLGAVIFSAFHHIGAQAERFTLGPFAQRTFAGLYFSAIYFNRSFGVAAASHALYDILVGLNQYV